LASTSSEAAGAGSDKPDATTEKIQETLAGASTRRMRARSKSAAHTAILEIKALLGPRPAAA
jgi:hypothetical protein